MLEIISDIATMIISVFAVWVGYKQWKTSEYDRLEKLKPDLRECYKKLADAQSLLDNTDILDRQALNLAHDARDLARILLPDDLSDFAQTYFEKIKSLYSKQFRIRNDSRMPEEERSRYLKEIAELSDEL